jgi:hypothetical protein
MRQQPFAKTAPERGYRPVYRKDRVNHCPSCERSHWYVGRTTAECGFCGTAIPIADSKPKTELAA